MWHFKTDKVGDGIEIEFSEYFKNKRLNFSPNIMEYDKNNYEPKFDLIIGTKLCKNW